ncbi:hypothetical protein TNCT_370081 [Trichonephila clavata]|uniref:Uncharacterized protein n=1 Tax=Trichonephila clavata TaxID=2740835 RepID=A0A8X6HXM5_TRICU|nr:hypothetical protein TNCT_370081 [Trichonephila clavata]
MLSLIRDKDTFKDEYNLEEFSKALFFLFIEGNVLTTILLSYKRTESKRHHCYLLKQRAEITLLSEPKNLNLNDVKVHKCDLLSLITDPAIFLQTAGTGRIIDGNSKHLKPFGAIAKITRKGLRVDHHSTNDSDQNESY